MKVFGKHSVLVSQSNRLWYKRAACVNFDLIHKGRNISMFRPLLISIHPNHQDSQLTIYLSRRRTVLLSRDRGNYQGRYALQDAT